MNLSNSFIENAEKDLQLYAAKGLLSCDNYKKIYVDDIVNLVVLNIFVGMATAVAYIARLRVFSLLFKSTLGLAAIFTSIIFYRLIFLKTNEAKTWEPFFEDVLTANYKAALEKLNKILEWQNNSNKKFIFKILEPLTFDKGLNQEIRINYLRAVLTTFQALIEISTYGVKEEKEIKELTNKLELFIDNNEAEVVDSCKNQLLMYNRREGSSQFIPKKIIQSVRNLLLVDFIEVIKKIEISSVESPKLIDKPIRYLRQLRYFHDEQQDHSMITNMIHSKTFDELLLKIQNQPKTFEKPLLRIENIQKTFDELLLEHLESPIYANKIFNFEEKGIIHQVRIICNPENKTLTFSHEGIEKFSFKDSYIIASKESIPKLIYSKLPKSIIPKLEKTGYRYITYPIDNIYPIHYTALPTLS